MRFRGGHSVIEEKQTLDNAEEIVATGSSTVVIECHDLTCQPIDIPRVTVIEGGSFHINRPMNIGNVAIALGTVRIQQTVSINHLQWTGGTIECVAGQILRIATVEISSQRPARLVNCRLEVTTKITMAIRAQLEVQRTRLTVTANSRMLMYRKSNFTCEESVLQNMGELIVRSRQNYTTPRVTIDCPLVNEASITVENVVLHVSQSLRHSGSVDVQSTGSLVLTGDAVFLPDSSASVNGQMSNLEGTFELGLFTGVINQLTCNSLCDLKDGSAIKISRLIVQRGRVNVDGAMADASIPFVDVKGQLVLNVNMQIEDLRLSGDVEVNGIIGVTTFVWTGGVVAGSGQMSVRHMDLGYSTQQEIRNASLIIAGPLIMEKYYVHTVSITGTGSLRNGEGNVLNLTASLSITGHQLINDGEIHIVGAESDIVLAASVVNNGLIRVQGGAKLKLSFGADHYGSFEVAAGCIVSVSSFTAHSGSTVTVADSLDVDGDSAFLTHKLTIGEVRLVKSGNVRVNIPSDRATFSLSSVTVSRGSLLLQGISEQPYPLNTALVSGGILDIRQNCSLNNATLESGTMYVRVKTSIRTLSFHGGTFTSGSRRVFVEIEDMVISTVDDKTILMTAITITRNFHWADQTVFLDAILLSNNAQLNIHVDATMTMANNRRIESQRGGELVNMGTVTFEYGTNNTFLTHADFTNRGILQLMNVGSVEFHGHFSSTTNLVLPPDSEIHFRKNTIGHPFAITGDKCFVYNGAHIRLNSTSVCNKIVVYYNSLLSVHPSGVARFDIPSVEVLKGSFITMVDSTIAEMLVDSGSLRAPIGFDVTITVENFTFAHSRSYNSRSSVENLNLVIDTDLLVEGRDFVLDESSMVVNGLASYLSDTQVIMRGSSAYRVGKNSQHSINHNIQFIDDGANSCVLEVSGNIILRYDMTCTCLFSSTGRLEIPGSSSTVHISQVSGSLGEINTASGQNKLLVSGTETFSLSSSSSFTAGTYIRVYSGRLIADVTSPSPFGSVQFVVSGGTLELRNSGGVSDIIPNVDIINYPSSELFITGDVTVSQFAVNGGVVYGSSLTTTNMTLSGGYLANDAIVAECLTIVQNSTFRRGTFEISASLKAHLVTGGIINLEDEATLILQETAGMDVRGDIKFETMTSGIFQIDGQITLFTPYTLDIGVRLIESSSGNRTHQPQSWLHLRSESTLSKPMHFEGNSGIRFYAGSQTTVTESATLTGHGGEWRVYGTASVTSSVEALRLVVLYIAGSFTQRGKTAWCS